MVRQGSLAPGGGMAGSTKHLPEDIVPLSRDEPQMSLDTEEIATPGRTASEARSFKLQRRQTRKLKLFEPALVKMATKRSFIMLNPVTMARNPVMFLVEIGWILT